MVGSSDCKKTGGLHCRRSLKKKYPQFAAEFAVNLAALTKDLDRLTDLLQPSPGQALVPLVTATPLQKFFARAAGVGDLHLTWFAIPDAGQADSDLKAVLKGAEATEGVVLFDRELPSAEVLGCAESPRGSSAVA